MSKMLEAWEKFCATETAGPTGNFEFDLFYTGYQAAIAAVKEGGPVARFNWNEAKFEWLTPYRYSEHHLTPLYRVPEDFL